MNVFRVLVADELQCLAVAALRLVVGASGGEGVGQTEKCGRTHDGLLGLVEQVVCRNRMLKRQPEVAESLEHAAKQPVAPGLDDAVTMLDCPLECQARQRCTRAGVAFEDLDRCDQEFEAT